MVIIWAGEEHPGTSVPLPEAGGRPSEGFDTTPINQTQTFYSEKFGFELRQRKMEVREMEGGGINDYDEGNGPQASVER